MIGNTGWILSHYINTYFFDLSNCVGLILIVNMAILILSGATFAIVYELLKKDFEEKLSDVAEIVENTQIDQQNNTSRIFLLDRKFMLLSLTQITTNGCFINYQWMLPRILEVVFGLGKGIDDDFEFIIIKYFSQSTVIIFVFFMIRSNKNEIG